MCRNTSFGEKYSPLHQNDKHREIIQGLSLPGDGSLEALAAHVEMAAPADLTDFLSGFQVRLNPPSFELLQMVLCTININPSLNSTQHPPLSVTWPQLRE